MSYFCQRTFVCGLGLLSRAFITLYGGSSNRWRSSVLDQLDILATFKPTELLDPLMSNPRTIDLIPLAPSALKNFCQQFMEAYLKSEQKLIENTSGRPLKGRNSNLLYDNSHINCNYFYKQCQFHLRVTGYECKLFIASFQKTVFFINGNGSKRELNIIAQ